MQDRSAAWLAGGSIAAAVGLVVATIVWSWRLQVLAGVLQVLGIILALLGVAVVWSSLQLVRDKAIAARHGLDRWWAISTSELRTRWARLLRHRMDATVFAPAATGSASAPIPSVAVGPPRVDRDTVSDRDWLAFLDDQVQEIYDRLEQSDKRRTADGSQVRRELATQREELRAEIQRETRQGWQLIVAGLAWSGIGTIVGIFG